MSRIRVHGGQYFLGLSFVLIFASIYLSVSYTPPPVSHAEVQEPSRQMPNHANHLQAEERDQFVFTLIKYASFCLANNNYGFLLNLLNHLERPCFDYEIEKRIIFYKAECNLRMGNFETAYDQYQNVKMLIHDLQDPLSAEVADKISQADKSRKSRILRFREKVGSFDLDDESVRSSILIACALFLILIVFARIFGSWHHGYLNEGKYGASLVGAIKSWGKPHFKGSPSTAVSRSEHDEKKIAIIDEQEPVSYTHLRAHET